MDKMEWLGAYDPQGLRDSLPSEKAVRKMSVSVNNDSTTRWPKNVDASQLGATLNEVGDRPALERMMRELREAEDREICTALAYGEMRQHREAGGKMSRWVQLTPSERYVWRQQFNLTFDAVREYSRSRTKYTSGGRVEAQPPGPIATFMQAAQTIAMMDDAEYRAFVDDLRAMTQVNP